MAACATWATQDTYLHRGQGKSIFSDADPSVAGLAELCVRTWKLIGVPCWAWATQRWENGYKQMCICLRWSLLTWNWCIESRLFTLLPFLNYYYFLKVWIPSCHSNTFLKLKEQEWSLALLLKSRTPADFDTPEFVLLEDYNISLYFFRNSIYKGAFFHTHIPTPSSTEKL